MRWNLKETVRKNVTTFNLAYSLQKRGKKVLAVDFDPQANLTTCFGAEEVDATIGELMINVIEDEELSAHSEYIRERNGVGYIPSSIGLSAVGAKLRLEMGTEKILAATDEVIVAAPPQLLAMMGLQDFSRIPITVKVGESVYYSKPLIEYVPESNACKAYEKLAGEVIAYEG